MKKKDIYNNILVELNKELSIMDAVLVHTESVEVSGRKAGIVDCIKIVEKQRDGK